MGFEPVTSWLLVWCSTNWAMKLLMLGAGQFIVGSYVPVKEMSVNDIWNKSYIKLWKWNENEEMIIAGRFAYKSFRLQVDSPTLTSIRLHDLSCFTEVKINKTEAYLLSMW